MYGTKSAVRKKRKNKVEKGQVSVNVVEERAGEWLDEQTLENGETERCKYLGY